MSGADILRHAPSALMWVPDEALASYAGVADPVEAHVGAAMRLGVDIVLVDSQAIRAGERATALAEAGFAVAWAVAGPLSRVEEASGYSQVLADTARAPGVLAYRLDEALHEALDAVREGERRGAKLVILADDLASSSGWLVSPDFALEVLMRGYRRLLREVREAGAEALLHSDGDIRALYPALAQAGFAGVHIAGVSGRTRDTLFAAARREGLAVAGGIAASELDSTAVTSDIVAGMGATPDIVSDDGGMTTPEQLEAYASVVEYLARRAGGG